MGDETGELNVDHDLQKRKVAQGYNSLNYTPISPCDTETCLKV